MCSSDLRTHKEAPEKRKKGKRQEKSLASLLYFLENINERFCLLRCQVTAAIFFVCRHWKFFAKYFEGSDVIGSNVIFDDSNSGINICGGYGDGSALVVENTVTITGNSVIFEVYGGYSDRSDTGTVKNNHVIIESGAVDVYKRQK